MNLQRVATLARKESREILRDRLFSVLAIVVPATLMLTLGYGLTTDMEDVPIAILDHDRTPLSREYAHKFIGSRYFDFRGYLQRERQIDPLITAERVRVVVVIPPRFQSDLRHGRTVAVQSVVSGTVVQPAETVGGYVQATTAAFSQELAAQHLARREGLSRPTAEGRLAPVQLQARFFYNEPLDSRWGIVPGLMMIILMFTLPLLTAVSIVREKESGAIDNVYASNLTPAEFLAGKAIPYWILAVLNGLLLWGIVTLLYGVPFRGSPLAFLTALVLFCLCTTGLGLIVSLLVRSQIAAILVMIVLTLVPAVLFSGVFTPLDSLGTAGQFQSRLLPATYFNLIAQASFLKGLGFRAIWLEIATLGVYAAILLSIGWWQFTKRPKR
ncbi:MAG: ABC transporter permease [Planctomycetaceae bacterium]|nr:MAG: ABC transporter permease [Planctomycetaceae bacterium]